MPFITDMLPSLRLTIRYDGQADRRIKVIF